MAVFKKEHIASSENKHQFTAEANPSHNVFEGHFPNNPVVPGVCTLAMIKDCCAQILLRKVQFSEIKEVKFLSAILPAQHKVLDVNIGLKNIDDNTSIAAQVLCNDEIMMKLKAVLI